jgi:holliday junction DNA helicase RuvA
MIGYLKGKILTANRNPLLILAGSVGYVVHVLPRILPKMEFDSEQSLYIHTAVKDDAIDLYGVATVEEADLFTILLGVSGIGPKTALMIVDRGVDPVKKAIINSDVEFFQTIPRLGKKNAQKVIIELKSKIGSSKDLDLSDSESGDTQELLEILGSMGFAKSEIIAALKKLDTTDMTMEVKLRKILKLIGKQVAN